MASASKHGDLQQAVASAYVREMLGMNPVLHSPQILRRRREIWAPGLNQDQKQDLNDPASPPLKSTQAGPSEIAQERRLRKRGWECLERLQRDFFSLPPSKLQKYLKFISQDRFPEFAERAARFSVLLPHRDTLLNVARKTGDQEFSDAFLQSLICPAANAGPLREQYIQQIIEQRRVKPACKAIRTLVEQHPEIYQLERDWFDVLLDPKNQLQWRRHYSLTKSVASPLDANGARVLIGILVIVAIIVVPTLINPTPRPDRSRSSNFKLQTNSNANAETSRTSKSARDHDAMLRQLGQLTKNPAAANATPKFEYKRSLSEYADSLPASPAASPLVMPPGSPLVLPPLQDWSLNGTAPAISTENAARDAARDGAQDGSATLPSATLPPPVSPSASAFTSPPALRHLPADWPMAESESPTGEDSLAPHWRSHPNHAPLDAVIAETWQSPIEQMIRDDQAFARRLREATPPATPPAVRSPMTWPSLQPRSIGRPSIPPRTKPGRTQPQIPPPQIPPPQRPTRPEIPGSLRSRLDRIFDQDSLDQDAAPGSFESTDLFDKLPGLSPGF